MFNYRISLVAAPAVVLLLTASYWSVRIARADHYARGSSAASVQNAIRLAPWNAGYYILLADIQSGSGLENAARLNPDDAAVWIRRGLEAELRHDALAEQFLRRAAEVSAQYEPRWTLANYYFRHQQPQDFWHWTGQALAISYGDRRPIFNLCWTVTQDAERITQVLPDQPAVWRDYLSYLLTQNHIDAVPAVAARILGTAGKEDLPLLLQVTDTLIGAGRIRQAEQLWNQLCTRKLLPYQPLASAQGQSLTNGAFRFSFAPGGFDWRAPRSPGLESVRGQSTFLASFSRKEPETCDVLWQYLPVEPGRKYKIQFEFKTEDIAPGSGLHWRVFDTTGADLSSPFWKQSALTFTAARPLARLVLIYQRASGATRIEGSLAIRTITMGFEE